MLFKTTFCCFSKTRIKLTADTQPLQPLLHARHGLKHFLLFTSLKNRIAAICWDYYVQSIVLSTADLISPILRKRAISGKLLYLFNKKGNWRERWCNMFKVTKLGSAIAENLPCIICSQSMLAGSAPWVGTIVSAPDYESGEIQRSSSKWCKLCCRKIANKLEKSVQNWT